MLALSCPWHSEPEYICSNSNQNGLPWNFGCQRFLVDEHQQPSQLENIVGVALRVGGRQGPTPDVQLRIYRFYTSFLMDFPGCILAGVSAAVLLVLWVTTKASNRWCVLQKRVSSIVTGEQSLENRSSAPHRPSLCLLVVSSFIQLWRRELKHRLGSKTLSHHRTRMHPVFMVCTLLDLTPIRLSMQWFPPAVSLLKNPSGAHRDICACVPAAHVYHPSPQALSTERKRLAGVQLCKSHLDVAFVINNLGARLPPFCFSSSPSISSSHNLQFVSWFVSSE